jgi:hypothetical protein
MVPNQPSLDSGPLLLHGIGYAMTHQMSRVVVDPGSYYFLSLQTENAHVQLGGNPATPDVRDLTIDFQGSDLVFTHTLQYGIILWRGTNVVLQNFTADYSPLPFTQLRITAVDPARAELQFAVEPGWQHPSAFNSAQPSPGTGGVVVEIHMFRNGRPATGIQRMATQLPFTGDRFVVPPLYGFDPTPENMAKIRAGDVAVVAMRQFGEPIVSYRCRGCTFRNISVYAAASAAIESTYSENTVWERVYSIPKPGTDRLISSFGFGFQGNGPNNHVRLSRAIRTLDGGIAAYVWATGDVESQPSPRSVVVFGAGGALGQGVTLPDGSPVVFQRRSDGAILASAVMVSQTGSVEDFNPIRLTYTFDRDLPSNLSGTVMYTTDVAQRGGNSVFERNNIQDKSCCFGMDIWGWANSVVSGNYIRRIGFSGIAAIQSLMTSNWTTPPLVNMVFRNNVIDGTQMSRDWWLHEMGGIEFITFGPDLNGNPDLMSSHAHQNISLLDNFIADSGRAAIWLGNTAGGTVDRNVLLHPNVRLDAAIPHPPWTDVIAPIVVDGTSSGIALSGNIVDQVSPRMFVTDTQYRDLAAYAPGGTLRLNAYGLGRLDHTTITVTDADGVTRPMSVETAAEDRLDVQLPAATSLGGAFVTVTAGGTKHFGTLFVDSQDHIPAVNGCTFDVSVSSTSVSYAASSLPLLVVTQPGCVYQPLTFDTFVTAGDGGSGPGVTFVSLAANMGPDLRTATIEIAGQQFTITQTAVAVGGPFTDATLSGMLVKALHVNELRARIDALRLQAGLPLFAWTDAVIRPALTQIRSTHLQELRIALDQAYGAVRRAPPQYTDPTIIAGSTAIRAVHIAELRSAVLALEQP